MGPIGKNNDLVTLLHAKTKIKKEDIVEIIRNMPECMAEAFIMSNTPEGKPVDFGGISISWFTNARFGSILRVKVNKVFKKHFIHLKVQEKHPLAIILCKLMYPINRERAIKRSKSESVVV